jgi:hypothetical protein
MNTRALYWYARGYYDGRSEGVRDDNVTEYPDADRQAYKDGYDRGVTDYCDYDDPTPLEDTSR